MPIGAPGWPELACCTASIASARIALAIMDVEVEETATSMRMQSKWAEKRAFYGPGPDGPEPTQAALIIGAMQGLHLTADLRGCAATQPALTDPHALRRLC